MAIRKPHTALLKKATQTPAGAGKTVGVAALGADVEIECFLQPMKPDAAFQATGLELERPYRVFCDLVINGVAIQSAAPVGSHLIWNGKKYLVRSIEPHFYGSALDHAVLYCEEKQR